MNVKGRSTAPVSYAAHLSSYTVTRKGRGVTTARERGIQIQHLAPMFRGKMAEPYWVNTTICRSCSTGPFT